MTERSQLTHADWMHALAQHVAEMRHAFPDDELAIVFDIDGTIVDTRHLVVHTLLAYDRGHGTTHFVGVTADDIVHHESRIDDILMTFDLTDAERRHVGTWFRGHAWDPAAVVAAHQPYQGVLGVIRWFQLQPKTHVLLNTGRPESLREVTLTALNELGRRHRVAFRDEHLHMNAGAPDAVAVGKVEALRRMRADGFRIAAVVDNEPNMIATMADDDERAETLFLHADTIFESRRAPTPRTVSGSAYGLSRIVDEAELGRRVTFVWHGVNDQHNLRQFLGSEVRWAEMDVRRDPGGRLVLRHDPFADAAWTSDADLLGLTECLEAIGRAGRSVKLDLKESEATLDGVLSVVETLGFDDRDLWFNAGVDTLGEAGFRRIRRAHPGAIVQCPIDFLVPLVLTAPVITASVWSMLRGWGIDRVSLDWATPMVGAALDAAEAEGWDVNVYGVPDLETFLEAALLLPASVTADFNFPDWRYDGRGPARALAARARS